MNYQRSNDAVLTLPFTKQKLQSKVDHRWVLPNDQGKDR